MFVQVVSHSFPPPAPPLVHLFIWTLELIMLPGTLELESF